MIPFCLAQASPFVTSGSPLRISDTATWPPAILFDAVYAGAVVHHFGTKALVAEFTASWESSYYPGGVTAATAANLKANTDRRAADKHKSETQAHDGPPSPDTFDMLLGLSSMFLPKDQILAAQRQLQEGVEAKKWESISAWLREIAAASCE